MIIAPLKFIGAAPKKAKNKRKKENEKTHSTRELKTIPKVAGNATSKT